MSWLDEDSDPFQRMIACENEDMPGCRFVACDDLNCRALKDPQTPDEWRAAAEHWRRHVYMGGCSHGR